MPTSISLAFAKMSEPICALNEPMVICLTTLETPPTYDVDTSITSAWISVSLSKIKRHLISEPPYGVRKRFRP